MNTEKVTTTSPALSDDFVKAVILPIFALEGGIHAGLLDRGGAHKFGIASRYYPEVARPDFGPSDALEIYKKIAFESGAVRLAAAMGTGLTGLYAFVRLHFVGAVNIGNNRATKILQGMLVSNGAELTIDGVLGAATADAMAEYIDAVGHDFAVFELRGAYIGWYINHADASSQSHFRKGWLRRVGLNLREATSSMSLAETGKVIKKDQLSKVASDTSPCASSTGGVY